MPVFTISVVYRCLANYRNITFYRSTYIECTVDYISFISVIINVSDDKVWRCKQPCGNTTTSTNGYEIAKLGSAR